MRTGTCLLSNARPVMGMMPWDEKFSDDLCSGGGDLDRSSLYRCPWEGEVPLRGVNSRKMGGMRRFVMACLGREVLSPAVLDWRTGVKKQCGYITRRR